jgi:hypothetical protein
VAIVVEDSESGGTHDSKTITQKMCGSSEHRSKAVPGSSLEELLADRIAIEAARIANEHVKAMFAVTEFDPDEVHGFMNSEEAAEFLGLPYSSFREIAPSLPRHAITPARFGYLRAELLAWGRDR